MVKVILPYSTPAGQGSPKRLENSATELRTSRKKLRRWEGRELGQMTFTIVFVYEKYNFYAAQLV